MAGLPDDICTRVLAHLRQTGGERIPARMLGALERAGEQGDPESLRMLGYLYEHGLTMPQDREAAFAYYKQAAEMGSSVGAYNVGIMLSQPERYGTLGVELSGDDRQREAVQWWERAFALGDTDSAVCLGEAYEKGRGVPEDVTYALRLYVLATERGNAEGAIRLAHCYQRGIGVGQDQAEVVRLLTIACDQDRPWACYELGTLYYGEEIASDDPANTALRYFERAAQLGLPIAQECCGEMYVMGHQCGICRDLDKGVYFLQRAVKANRSRAKYVMACLLANGEGVARDLDEATRLCLDAAEAGEADADDLMRWIQKHGRPTGST